MSEPLLGVVFAHADVGAALVSAVRAIAGEEHGLVAVSNEGCDRAALASRLNEVIAERRAILFTDLPGGSCAFGAAAYAHEHPGVRVVTGVNLAILLDFAFHRGESLDAAAARAVETGRAAVTSPRAGP
jgi:mannose/fructose-specific phosphotransferase system component IIA